MNKLALLFVALMIPVAAVAQGSGSVTPSTGTVGPGGGDPFEVTKTIKLTVVEVRANGTIAVKDETGQAVVVKVEKSVSISAEKGTELAGQKKMKIDRLEPGMVIRATYRVSDNIVVAIRILKVKKVA